MIDLKVIAELCMSAPTADKVHQELNFGMLLEPKLRKLFYETYDELPEQYSGVFNVLNSKKAKETDYGMGAMTPWTEFGKTNGAYDSGNMPEVPFEKINAGLERTYVHAEFAKGFAVERKFVDDEMYSVIEKMPKDLARAGRYKVETDACSLFNNAFTNKGYDDVPLISASHKLANSTSKGNNLITGELNEANLRKALELGRKQVDEAGKLIQMKFDTLVVPPALEFTAKTLLNSTLLPGSELNDTNVLKGALKIVVLDFLTSDTAWFVLDSKRHQLNFFWRVRPEFKREEDFNTLVQKYRGYMRYSLGYSDYRGVIGSTGVTSTKEGKSK